MPLTEAQVRYWLSSFDKPGALADSAMRSVLRAHGRPYRGSDTTVSEDARTLLVDLIESLRPRDPDAPRRWRARIGCCV